MSREPVRQPPAPTQVLQLCLLGPPQVRLGSAPVRLPTRKSLWLLAYLALEGPQDRGELAALLWDEGGEEQARSNLRSELHRLRGTPVAPFLDVDNAWVGVLGVTCDVTGYRQYLRAGQVAEAAALCRGELLSGAGGGPAFEEWLCKEREALASERAEHLSQHARAREVAVTCGEPSTPG